MINCPAAVILIVDNILPCTSNIMHLVYRVQSRFAGTWFAETRFAETLTLTLTPNFAESGFGELGRHRVQSVLLMRPLSSACCCCCCW